MSGRRDLREALERLAEKYSALAALRSRREEAEAAGRAAFDALENAERSAAFRRVASEFPGALRELETATAAVLEAKARAVQEEIEALRRDPGRGAPGRAWVGVVLDYHAFLREAIAVKTWLAGNLARNEAITPQILERFRAWHAALPFAVTPPDSIDEGFLARHRRPPGGRLHAIVWEALAERHGLGPRDLERAIFGPCGGPDRAP